MKIEIHFSLYYIEEKENEKSGWHDYTFDVILSVSQGKSKKKRGISYDN